MKGAIHLSCLNCSNEPWIMISGGYTNEEWNGVGILMTAGFQRVIINGALCIVLLLLSRGGFAQQQPE